MSAIPGNNITDDSETKPMARGLFIQPFASLPQVHLIIF